MTREEYIEATRKAIERGLYGPDHSDPDVIDIVARRMLAEINTDQGNDQ
jgi:hypothetical protein